MMYNERIEPYYKARTSGVISARAANPFGPTSITDSPLYMDRNVYRVGNRIYFYDSVDEVTQMMLEQLIKEATIELAQQRALEVLDTGSINASIYIYVNSPGGLCSSGFALYDVIKSSKIPVTTVINGAADSAATLIFLAGKTRAMTDNSTFLMHQCSWGCWGQNRLMQDMAKNAEKVMMKLRRIYFNETEFAKVGTTWNGIDIKDDKTRIAAIQSQLEHDTEWSYDECKEYGIINYKDVDDEMLTEEEMEKVDNFIEEMIKARVEKQEQEAEEKVEEKATEKPVEKPAEKPSKEPTEKPKTPKKKGTKKVENEAKDEASSK